jgi:translation elongation factor EF-Tu-like GTPase
MPSDHIKLVVIEKKMHFAIHEGGHTIGASVVSRLLH